MKPNKFSRLDHVFMQKALELAALSLGRVSPDPMVGAVLTKNHKIIATGYHEKFASPHAEAWALDKAKEKAQGSTLYINLEPCAHFGNNPPCVDYIIQSKIKRVVCAMSDPNPLVNGKGIAQLRKAGIKVEVGLLEKEAKKLNEVFIKHITTGLPFVVLKCAMTLDGKIASRSGDSKWISSDESLRFAHMLRSQSDAIIVGINTVLQDNPLLTTRKVKGKNPLRIILDSQAKTPLNAKVILDKSTPTVIATSKAAPPNKVKALKKAGAQIIYTTNLKKIIQELGASQINSVLIEGGGEVAYSALAQKIVDKIYFIVAPKIVGGREAKSPVEGKGLNKIAHSIKIKGLRPLPCGQDIILEGYIEAKK